MNQSQTKAQLDQAMGSQNQLALNSKKSNDDYTKVKLKSRNKETFLGGGLLIQTENAANPGLLASTGGSDFHGLTKTCLFKKSNPLQNFEKAKFASKSHGLITSYAANTH